MEFIEGDVWEAGRSGLKIQEGQHIAMLGSNQPFVILVAAPSPQQAMELRAKIMRLLSIAENGISAEAANHDGGYDHPADIKQSQEWFDGILKAALL